MIWLSVLSTDPSHTDYLPPADDHPSYDPAVVLKSHNLVRAALEDIAAGRPVAIPSTQPYGCAVGMVQPDMPRVNRRPAAQLLGALSAALLG